MILTGEARRCDALVGSSKVCCSAFECSQAPGGVADQLRRHISPLQMVMNRLLLRWKAIWFVGLRDLEVAKQEGCLGMAGLGILMRSKSGSFLGCIVLDSSIAASAYAGHLHSKSAIPPTLPAAP
ncbi:hypothetical protein K470DRAFT_259450 [Piedraia hortae CBS 480.64]|uniref:Uncharacterized protein n=1 Tax=Piedraia hortae CBS 480.64 TaxID=1314780 RepID=A0A6A7BUN7_9PEZI|nr:hypothetical protein K470DRAFT_259450 [Piedraia hortae CBS 480.64]